MSQIKEKLLICITGGIAAYKTVFLVREAVKLGYEVRVILTPAAHNFVTPITLEAVSKNKVLTELFDRDAELSMSHIELAKWADLILIAPATANTIAKIANGYADNLLTTVIAAKPEKTPLLIAPAMNKEMYNKAITQKHLKYLVELGYTVLPTDSGSQACGDVGFGRMLEPEELLNIINKKFNNNLDKEKIVGFTDKDSIAEEGFLADIKVKHLEPIPKQKLNFSEKSNFSINDLDDFELAEALKEFKGKHILVTAGPTREMIDPVRYITNHSSGKMGVYIAALAQKFGAKVTLICGPISIVIPENIRTIKVESAAQMNHAVQEALFDIDCFIGCAAVSDFRAKEISTHKIKKTSSDELVITLTKNPDILFNVSNSPNRPTYVVGFAAETNNVEEYARNKVLKKNCDCICANDVSKENQGWNSDFNQLTLYKADGSTKDLGYDLKEVLAKRLIMDIARELYRRIK